MWDYPTVTLILRWLYNWGDLKYQYCYYKYPVLMTYPCNQLPVKSSHFRQSSHTQNDVLCSFWLSIFRSNIHGSIHIVLCKQTTLARIHVLPQPKWVQANTCIHLQYEMTDDSSEWLLEVDGAYEDPQMQGVVDEIGRIVGPQFTQPDDVLHLEGAVRLKDVRLCDHVLRMFHLVVYRVHDDADLNLTNFHAATMWHDQLRVISGLADVKLTLPEWRHVVAVWVEHHLHLTLAVLGRVPDVCREIQRSLDLATDPGTTLEPFPHDINENWVVLIGVVAVTELR